MSPLPAGWTATFKTLDLPADSRVLVAPFPYSATSQVLRWQADSGYPATMIGGDFIEPGKPGRLGRAGRAGMTPTSYYIDYLWENVQHPVAPSPSQISTDLNTMKPNAVVAVTRPGTRLGRFLIQIFGQPTTRIGNVLGWRLRPGWTAPGSG